MYGPKWPCLLMYMSHEIDVGTGCSLGRAPRTKETLPDFHEWCRVTRHPRLFRRLTGCQRTTGFGASQVTIVSLEPLESGGAYPTSNLCCLRFYAIGATLQMMEFLT